MHMCILGQCSKLMHAKSRLNHCSFVVLPELLFDKKKAIGEYVNIFFILSTASLHDRSGIFVSVCCC